MLRISAKPFTTQDFVFAGPGKQPGVVSIRSSGNSCYAKGFERKSLGGYGFASHLAWFWRMYRIGTVREKRLSSFRREASLLL